MFEGVELDRLKRRSRMKGILIFVAVALFGSVVLLAESNPFIGTWKLNIAKSKYSSGPAPRSQTQTYETQGNGMKVSSEGTAADGSRIAWSYTANFDGKDYPISGIGAPNGADIVAIRRINTNTYEATFKKGGKAVGTGRDEVSKDGKIKTVAATGTDANGKSLTRELVWDKQ
jgi:hypothetical protein